MDGLGWVGDGPDVVGNGWDVMVEALGKREVETTTLTRREEGLCNFLPFLRDRAFEYFLYIFSGFAIDRSKKYIKVIKIYIKFDAVDPQAAADNPHGNNG